MSCRSLADVESEGQVRVRGILFEGVRAECGLLGIQAGDALRVVRHSSRNVVLRTDDGRSLGCPVEFARFIEIETAQEEK